MNKIPIAVPAVRILAKNLGNNVAAKTVRADVSGNAEVPGGNINLVAILPIVTSVDAIAKDTEMVGKEIWFRSGSIAINVVVVFAFPDGMASKE